MPVLVQLFHMTPPKYVRYAACLNHLTHLICDGAILLAYIYALCSMDLPA